MNHARCKGAEAPDAGFIKLLTIGNGMDLNVERFSTVIDAVASRQFYPRLLTYLERFFRFNNAIVYAFERGAEPRCVMKSESENSDAVNRIYQSGAYLQDPFYQVLNRSGDSRVLTLTELTPGGFRHTDYYRDFYHKTGWRDEAAILLPLSEQRGLGIFLGTDRRHPDMCCRHLPEARTVLGLVKSVVRLHCNVSTAPDNAPPGETDGMLTPREREIVDMILSGLASPQIAQRLFISLGTVKNHRKNIYAKLGVSSQAALFSRYMAPSVVMNAT